MTDELAYTILGIISIYGACTAILCIRLIRNNRIAKQQTKELAECEEAMKELLEEVKRILNQTHGSTRR